MQNKGKLKMHSVHTDLFLIFYPCFGKKLEQNQMVLCDPLFYNKMVAKQSN